MRAVVFRKILISLLFFLLGGVALLSFPSSASAQNTISGIVFIDIDQNGIYQPRLGDLLYGGHATITRFAGGAAFGSSVQSDNNGFYQFTDVPSGTYYVQISSISGYRNTTPQTVQVTVDTSNPQASVYFGLISTATPFPTKPPPTPTSTPTAGPPPPAATSTPVPQVNGNPIISTVDGQATVKQGGFIGLEVAEIYNDPAHDYRISITNNNSSTEWDYISFLAGDKNNCSMPYADSGIFVNGKQILESHELYSNLCHVQFTIQVRSDYNCNPGLSLSDPTNKCRVLLNDKTLGRVVSSTEFAVEATVQDPKQTLTASVSPDPVVAEQPATISASGCPTGEQVSFVWWKNSEIDAACVTQKLKDQGSITDKDCGDGDSSADFAPIYADANGTASFVKGGNNANDSESFSAGQYYMAAFCENGHWGTKEFTASEPLATLTPTHAAPTPPHCAELEYKDGGVDESGNPRPSIFVGCKSIDSAIGNIPVRIGTFINRLLQFLIGIGAGIAVIIIIYAGYKLMTSRGDPEGIQNAKNLITSAIVGLLFIIFSIIILEVIGVDILKIPHWTY